MADIASRLLTSTFQDEHGQVAITRNFLEANADDTAIGALQDAMQAVSDLSLRGSTKITRNIQDASEPTAGVGNGYNSARAHLVILMSVTGPESNLKISIPGPTGVAAMFGKDGIVPGDDAALDTFFDAVSALIKTEGGNAPSGVIGGRLQVLGRRKQRA